ncbi:hypothetical protein ACX3PU_03620 [Chryseobacterium sp. A301]
MKLSFSLLIPSTAQKWSLIFLLPLFLSCTKEIPRADTGGADLLFSVYFQASKGLENSKTFHRSSLSFLPIGVFEIAPSALGEVADMEYFLIKDSLYYGLEAGVRISMDPKAGKSVLTKTHGAPFSKDPISYYGRRRNLSDTILFKRHYKRFEISTPEQYSRYYILKSDSLLPYALYPQIEQEYGGRLERIDYYDVEKDIFYSMQLLRRLERSKEAESFLKEGYFVPQTPTLTQN